MKHLGDITKIHGNEIDAVDCITGGSPCQDLSIAGKREGLAGNRSGLFTEMIRIIKEMRERDIKDGRTDYDIRPRFVIWENVPGAFSSNKGADFGCVLEEFARIKEPSVTIPRPTDRKGRIKWKPAGCIVGNSWSIVWRTLDAQFWGVPQRRKRIALVADFAGQCAPEILFEREGLSGYSAEGFRAWQKAAGSAEASPDGTGRTVCLNDQGGNCMDVTEDVTNTLRAESHHPPLVPVLFENHSQDARYTGPLDKSPSLTARYGTGGNNQPLVVKNSTFDVRFTSEGTKNARQNCYETDTARTLDTGGNAPNSNQGGIAVVDMGGGKSSCNVTKDFSPTLTCTHGGEPAVCMDNTHHCEMMAKQDESEVIAIQGSMIGREDKNGPLGSGVNEDASFTLNATDRHAVAYNEDELPCYSASKGDYQARFVKNHTSALTATDYKDPPIVMEGKSPYIVRRLTPLECERLQGYPTIREVRFTEMTKDEYIAWNIHEGNVIVDTERGKVFRTRGQRGTKLDEPKEMPGTNINGYLCVSIRNGETKMLCRVHRIVWIAAHGIIPDGYVIDHINNNKQDNRIANLQLLTPEENSRKAKEDGLYLTQENSPSAKITDEVHDLIQYIYGNSEISIRQLSEMFGISKSRVHQIVHDKGWTDIGEWTDTKGKLHKPSDSARYKALGNSIALPQWQWIIDRMAYYLPQGATLGSLFDGIGGFPLCWQRTHGNGTAVWASEVEKFCIAVTKKRFNGK